MNADPITNVGSFYMSLIPLSVYMIIYEEMIREKMGNLRLGLLAIGCSNVAFWISWLITGVLFSALMSVLMYIVGFIYGFPIFINSPFYTLFIL